MKKILFLLSLILLFSCQKELIRDTQLKEKVTADFQNRKESLKDKDFLWKVFDQPMNNEERQAMMFLYAYMPLNDLADYDGEFFLKNLRMALKARNEMPWGKKVPVVEFLHFVLPHRVNNENLDSAKTVIFKELKERIIGMTMRDAVLEINHWCHEKVSYKGADSRTSAPLASIKSAIGRCGEESTFTVTALRAMGIPARQVYTPRWVHCDDNHAWVEAYVDGKWYFLGACEPNPDLNQGWFAEPARRAMLLHTKVFGDYTGTEKISLKEKYYTELNVLDNYAKTKKIHVIVKDTTGKAIKNAKVEFKVYNYAEFYSLVKLKTDEKGYCNFITGLGDLLIWASNDKAFGFEKITVANVDTVYISLNKTKIDKELNFDMKPPVEPTPIQVPETGKKENEIRLKNEDKIRSAYEATFIKKDEAFNIAQSLGLDTLKTWTVFQKSRGNWADIKSFITAVSKDKLEWALPYLNVIAEKDLRDTPSSVLLDLFNSSFVYQYSDKTIFEKEILNPRIGNELLSTYKSFFLKTFDKKQIEEFRNDPKTLEAFINKTIKIDEEGMFYNTPMMPKGVHKLQITNESSRNIYFVALCRSFGIPSHLDQATSEPQYFANGKWINVFVPKTDEAKLKQSRGFATLKTKNQNAKYYFQFTLEALKNNGYSTLEFDEAKEAKDFGKVNIQTGDYIVVSGNRMKDGSVLCNIKPFKIEGNKTTTINFEIREQTASQKTIYGKVNTNLTFEGLNKKALTTQGIKKYVLVWMDPDKEPTKHLLQDLTDMKLAYEKSGITVFLIIPKEKYTSSFNKNLYKLPSNAVYCIDNEQNSKKIKEIESLKLKTYPIVLGIDEKQEIVITSQGYKIGLGDMILETLK